MNDDDNNVDSFESVKTDQQKTARIYYRRKHKTDSKFILLIILS